jgi:hypothetical protein
MILSLLWARDKYCHAPIKIKLNPLMNYPMNLYFRWGRGMNLLKGYGQVATCPYPLRRFASLIIIGDAHLWMIIFFKAIRFSKEIPIQFSFPFIHHTSHKASPHPHYDIFPLSAYTTGTLNCGAPHYLPLTKNL